MSVVHSPHFLEFICSDSCEVLLKILRVLSWCWSILEVAEDQKGPTNNDEENDGEETQRSHISKYDHVYE